MQIITYKEYVITGTAFKDEQGRWIGQAEIEPLTSGSEAIRIADPMVFDNERFDFEGDAESFALDSAQFFIDEQIHNAGYE